MQTQVLIRESFQQTEIYFVRNKRREGSTLFVMNFAYVLFFVNFLCTAFSSVKKENLNWYLNNTVGHYMENTAAGKRAEVRKAKM